MSESTERQKCSYINIFDDASISENDLKEKLKSFSDDFMQSGLMKPNAMEAMGDRMWASKESLKNDAPSMSADDVCVCLSAFVQQDAFIPGILLDLVKQGVIPEMLKRLKALD